MEKLPTTFLISSLANYATVLASSCFSPDL